MRVAMIGSTGLVGSLARSKLLARGCAVDALVRRPSGFEHPRWREHAAPPSEWPELVRALRPEAALSALGTTMRQAGSKDAFRAVDHDLVVGFARAAAESGASRMVTVSSVGADPESANFYLRTKGQMETALEGLGFGRLDILRPGLLRGRRGAERRLGERIGIVLSPFVNPFLRGSLDRFAAIDADRVAAAIAGTFSLSSPGTFRHENSAIRHLAGG